jgi:hypothetical protein
MFITLITSNLGVEEFLIISSDAIELIELSRYHSLKLSIHLKTDRRIDISTICTISEQTDNELKLASDSILKNYETMKRFVYGNNEIKEIHLDKNVTLSIQQNRKVINTIES